jgi:hypothetical protein
VARRKIFGRFDTRKTKPLPEPPQQGLADEGARWRLGAMVMRPMIHPPPFKCRSWVPAS